MLCQKFSCIIVFWPQVNIYCGEQMLYEDEPMKCVWVSYWQGKVGRKVLIR